MNDYPMSLVLGRKMDITVLQSKFCIIAVLSTLF